MLSEGKVRMSTFRVVYYLGCETHDDYLILQSAQQAVDHVRSEYPEAEVVEVAKVVNNWK